MIKIIAKMFVKPECVADFQTQAKELVLKSAAEEGIISYTLNRSTADPCVLAFIELWKDQAAIDSHNASEHFRRILPLLGAMCAKAPEVDLFDEIEY